LKISKQKEMSMKPILLPLLVSVFLLAACVPTADKIPAVSDPSQPITVKTGEIFSVVLESNPTTGYHWDVVRELSGTQFIGVEYLSTSKPGLVGGGGVDVWTFKAVSVGQSQITLGYYPPSNDPVEPQQTVTFTVSIK
jgi:inhibitor of cysteine peptidase